MSRVLIINSVCDYGSTGKICVELANKLKKEGSEVIIAYGRGKTSYEDSIKIGNLLDQYVHGIGTRLFDKQGLASKKSTSNFLKWAEEYDPDCLWIHNLHGYYINYEILFEWIKKRPKMNVKWTLHDCWAFTGHCAHFSAVGCEQWMTHCCKCCQKKQYPCSLFIDNCFENYEKKKAAFKDVANMKIIVPSNWLADLVKKSFLKCYPIEVQQNVVDKNVFRYRESNFRKQYGLKEKIILLGVANVWTDRKGYNDFVKLAGMLTDRFQIVLVGLDKKQMKKLPSNIIGIERTKDQVELAEIYSAADLYINPSKEETYGMTNAEALACGTVAIAYEGTACEEVVKQNGGIAVEQNVDAIYKVIKDRFSESSEKE